MLTRAASRLSLVPRSSPRAREPTGCRRPGGVEPRIPPRGEPEFKQIAGRVSGNYRGRRSCESPTARGREAHHDPCTDVRLEQIRGDATLNMAVRRAAGQRDRWADRSRHDRHRSSYSSRSWTRPPAFCVINAVSGSVSVKGLRTEGRIDVRGAGRRRRRRTRRATRDLPPRGV